MILSSSTTSLSEPRYLVASLSELPQAGGRRPGRGPGPGLLRHRQPQPEIPASACGLRRLGMAARSLRDHDSHKAGLYTAAHGPGYWAPAELGRHCWPGHAAVQQSRAYCPAQIRQPSRATLNPQ